MTRTLNLDDDLMKRAAELTGISDETELIHKALRAFIPLAAVTTTKRRSLEESLQALRELGGSMPDAKAAPRRRVWNGTEYERY